MLSFRPLGFDIKERFNEHYQACPVKTSDTSFINLWAWDNKYHSEIAFADDLCWLRFRQGENYFYGTPLGNWAKVKWNEVLEKHFPKEFAFINLPQKLAFELAKVYNDELSLQGDRNNWEYIYKINDLTNLSGSAYRNQRKLSNQFKQMYNYRFRFIDCKDLDNLRDFQQQWLEQEQLSGADQLELAKENLAIERVLDVWPQLGVSLFGAVLEIDKEIVAYTIGEKLDKETIAIHFEKALYDVKGAYQAINRITLENIGNYKYVNREQDLGLKGLRRAKLEYNPLHFIKKYNLANHYQILEKEQNHGIFKNSLNSDFHCLPDTKYHSLH